MRLSSQEKQQHHLFQIFPSNVQVSKPSSSQRKSDSCMFEEICCFRVTKPTEELDGSTKHNTMWDSTVRFPFPIINYLFVSTIVP